MSGAPYPDPIMPEQESGYVETFTPRRLKRVVITTDLLLEMLREGYRSPGVLQCVKGIPADARVLVINYDPACNAVFAFVEHESFEPVSPASEPPLIDVQFRIVAEKEVGTEPVAPLPPERAA